MSKKLGEQLPDLIAKPYATMVGKSVILDRILTYLHGSPDGKVEKMPLNKACDEAGVTWLQVKEWMQDDPELRTRWQGAIEAQQEVNRLKARDNIYQALNGEINGEPLTPKEIVDASFQFAKLTDDDFNPATKLDSRSVNVNADISREALVEELRKLAPIILSQADAEQQT